jgi:SAM-dependent methyltransferase
MGATHNKLLIEAIDEDLVISALPPPCDAIPQPLPTDFSQRIYALREQLDEPCTFAAYRAAMLDMARVNRWTGGYQPVLRLLDQAVQRMGVTHRPLRVLDLGCGHGDLLHTLHRWAAKRSLPLALTGVDLHPYAMRLARECDRAERLPSGTIQWLHANILEQPLPGADIVLCNLVAHHLPDADVVRLLQRCAQARVGFVLTDLRRSERACKIFRWISRLLQLDPMVEHDAIVSFHRAFSLQEWQTLVAEAQIQATVDDIGRGRVMITKLNV